jgi:hypothetical protein
MQHDLAMLGAPVHQRADRDFYPTIDQNVTRVLVDTLLAKGWLTKNDKIWECAAGAGDMSNVLEEYFSQVYSTDIMPLQLDYGTLDFLTQDPEFPVDAIITNPPFGKLVSSFMARGVEHIRNGRVRLVAMLARNELDCAKERTNLFKNCPEYAAKIVLTWRPRWIKDSTGSPRHQYAWFIFRNKADITGDPVILYATR